MDRKGTPLACRFVRLLVCLCLLSVWTPWLAAADRPCVPISGFARAPVAGLDAVVVDLMCKEGATAAVLGVMVDGEIVVQRGYGWYDGVNSRVLTPDAMMRIASITKPLVASVVRDLIDEGLLSLDDRAFHLGQAGGGMLQLEPFAKLGDERLKDVTIEHLLLHRGGWDRSEAGDLTYREIEIAEAMGVASPPGRKRTVQYILSQPLQFAPGQQRAYSNIGYLVLGLIVEQVTGKELVDVIHERVLKPLGVERSELIAGRSFREHCSDREPVYLDEVMVANVHDPQGPPVPRPYGGWDHEARVGQGGLVTTTQTLLRVLEARYINGPDIGKRRTGRDGPAWRRNHGGALHGLNAIARQRGDGVHYVFIINKRTSEEPSYANRVRTALDELFDAMADAKPSPGRTEAAAGAVK